MILPPGFPAGALAPAPGPAPDGLDLADSSIWSGAGDWASEASGEVSAADAAHGRVLAALGRVYLDHGNPARALVLGLAALAMGDTSPATVLLVAAAFLGAGDAEQARAALSRLEDADGRVAPSLGPAERAAHDWLMARVLLWQGQPAAARAAMERAFAAAPVTSVQPGVGDTR